LGSRLFSYWTKSFKSEYHHQNNIWLKCLFSFFVTFLYGNILWFPDNILYHLFCIMVYEMKTKPSQMGQNFLFWVLLYI
jgi:hypothetical protein